MERKEGWNLIINSRKWHYFLKDGRSLCNRFLIIENNSDCEIGNDSSPDNCSECKRKLYKLLIKDEISKENK